ncbi:MAG: hypothetical protein ACP5I4_01405 [Oceanipulchritudo sp.]
MKFNRSLPRLIAGLLILYPLVSLAQTSVPPEGLTNPDPEWESDLQNRIRLLQEARIFPNTSGYGDTDSGKRDWPALLSNAWVVENDPALSRAQKDLKLQEIMDGGTVNVWGQNFNGANTLYFSPYAGTFYKAFSCPGYNMTYFLFRDYPNRYPGSTVAWQASTEAEARDFEYWEYLTREDNYMDPIYTQTEFNSENFNWMARLCGLQWAFELPDVDLGTYEHNWQVGDPKGMSRPYYRNYMNNWVRALFNAGRVEWNSVNYWGYTFQPILALYEFPPDDPADPGYQAKVKLQARAGLDWMVLETALHYLDGFTGGADTRAKTKPHLPWAGAIWPYSYIYFAGDGFHPTFTPTDIETKASTDGPNLHGWYPWSSYRPLQVLIDIANRQFPLPVEIKSAKPFYHLDHDNYGSWSGDGSYDYWKANKSTAEVNHQTGFRYEFETIYMDENYLLSSISTYRPNGSIGTFSEQNLLRLVVQGSDYGAIQVIGNTGRFSTPAGRDPYEQIGQVANTMMRVIKAPNTSNNLWFAIPLQATRQWDGNRLWVDMGNGVYFGIIPFGNPSTSETLYNDGAAGHQQYRWSWSASALGGLVMEVGTEAEHGSFAAFKSTLGGLAVTSPATDQLEYTASNGNTIRMEWTGTSTYPMTEEGGYTLNLAGIVPRVWRNGVEEDFDTWEAYEVVYGFPVVHQAWGSGRLRMKTYAEDVEIVVDNTESTVEYLDWSGTGPAMNTVRLSSSGDNWEIEVPSQSDWRYELHGDAELQGSPHTWPMLDSLMGTGSLLQFQVPKSQFAAQDAVFFSVVGYEFVQ